MFRMYFHLFLIRLGIRKDKFTSEYFKLMRELIRLLDGQGTEKLSLLELSAKLNISDLRTENLEKVDIDRLSEKIQTTSAKSSGLIGILWLLILFSIFNISDQFDLPYFSISLSADIIAGSVAALSILTILAGSMILENKFINELARQLLQCRDDYDRSGVQRMLRENKFGVMQKLLQPQSTQTKYRLGFASGFLIFLITLSMIPVLLSAIFIFGTPAYALFLAFDGVENSLLFYFSMALWTCAVSFFAILVPAFCLLKFSIVDGQYTDRYFSLCDETDPMTAMRIVIEEFKRSQ